MSFTKFVQLPLELQRDIWELSAAEEGAPRMHFFTPFNAAGVDDSEPDSSLLHDARSGGKHHARLRMTCREAKRAVEKVEAKLYDGRPNSKLAITVWKPANDNTAWAVLDGFGLTSYRVTIDRHADLLCFDEPGASWTGMLHLFADAAVGLPPFVLNAENVAVQWRMSKAPPISQGSTHRRFRSCRNKTHAVNSFEAPRGRDILFCPRCFYNFLKQFIRLKTVYLILDDIPIPSKLRASLRDRKAVPEKRTLRWPEMWAPPNEPKDDSPLKVFYSSDRIYHELDDDKDGPVAKQLSAIHFFLAAFIDHGSNKQSQGWTFPQQRLHPWVRDIKAKFRLVSSASWP